MKSHFLFAACLTVAAASVTWAATDTTSIQRESRLDERRGARWGGVPLFSVSSDRGVTVGALAQRFDYGPDSQRPFRSHLVFQARKMMRGPTDITVSYEKIEIPLRWKLEAYASDSDYERFYGIGDSTSHDTARAQAGYYYYSHRAAHTAGTGRWRLPVGAPVDVQASAAVVSRGSRPNEGASLYGEKFGSATEHTVYARMGAGLVYDGRDSEFIPSQGAYVSVCGTISPSALSRDRTWRRFELDMRRYEAFFQDRWLWLAAQFRYTSTSALAPLEEKAKLGSNATLRGLPLYRYASDHSMTLRTELRSLWWRTRVFRLPLKTGAGIFADTGRIGDSLERLASNPTHYAWGLSFFFSYFTDDFITTVDFGFSREGTAYYVKLGHAF